MWQIKYHKLTVGALACLIQTRTKEAVPKLYKVWYLIIFIKNRAIKILLGEKQLKHLKEKKLIAVRAMRLNRKTKVINWLLTMTIATINFNYAHPKQWEWLSMKCLNNAKQWSKLVDKVNKFKLKKEKIVAKITTCWKSKIWALISTLIKSLLTLIWASFTLYTVQVISTILINIVLSYYNLVIVCAMWKFLAR